MKKNIIQPVRSYDNIIRCMRIACWIPKATNTVLWDMLKILIAFPLQQ